MALQFAVAPGVTAAAQVRADGRVDVRVGEGDPQTVSGSADAEVDADGERSLRLSHEDVDFDGHQDLLLRSSVGQVNEAIAVYRFVPQTGRFAAWPAPASAHANCDGFWSLTVDASRRSLLSTCRGGPMWYTDVYRVDAAGTAWLHRAERVLMLDPVALDSVLAIRRAEDAGPLAVWSTYSMSGRVLETALGDGLQAPQTGAPLQPVTARVVPARLPLYAKAGDAQTRRYLVRGDDVALLDERDGWLQVRYRNPTRGAVEGWVQVTLP